MINQASSPTRNEFPLDLNFQLPQENPKDEELQSVQELKSLCNSINFLANGNVLYRKELNGLADSILKKIAIMQLNGSKSEEILAYSKKSINKLQTVKDNFHNSKCTFKNNSLNFMDQCSYLEERINKSSNISFNSSSKPAQRLPTPEELMRGTPYWPDQREKPTPSILEKRSMFQIGQQSADIYEKFSEELQTTKDGFDNSKIKLETKSASFINQYNLLEKKLNNNSLVSSNKSHKQPSDSWPTPEEMMELDSRWKEKQILIQGEMNTLELVAPIATFVNDRFSDSIKFMGNNIQRAWSLQKHIYSFYPKYLPMAKLHDEVENLGTIAGNYLAKEAKSAFETIYKTEFIVKARNFFTTDSSKGLGVNPLVKYYHFSKEEVDRFDENTIQVLPYVLPYGTFCKGVAVPFRATVRLFARRGSPKAIDGIVNKTYRCTELYSEGSFKKQIKIIDLKPTEFTSSYSDLPSFYSRVKGFLKGDAGNIKSQVLPYILPYGTFCKGVAVPLRATAKLLTKSGSPKAIDEIVKKISTSIERHSEASFGTMLDRAHKKIGKFIPSYDHVVESGLESTGVWTRAINDTRANAIINPSVHYFIDSPFYTVAKLTEGSSSFIVKDTSSRENIINELMGLNFLHSLQLKHMRIPELVTVGSHSEGYNYFVVKNFLPGKTFGELFVELGALQNQTKRHSFLTELCEAALCAGRALGELQNKGVLNRATPRASLFERTYAVGVFFDRVEETKRLIPKTSSINIENFSPDIAAFYKNPGPLTFGFRDISGGQFIWNPLHKRPFGNVDAGFVSSTFTSAKKPCALAYKEYYEFMICFDSEGFIAGMLPSETSALKKYFARGYNAEYIGAQSPAADRFFDLLSSFETVNNLARELKVSKSNHIERLLQSKLNELDKKINNPPTIYANQKQTQIKNLKPTEINSSFKRSLISTRMKDFLKEDAGNITLSDFSKGGLIAERVNATSEQALYFPSMSEIHKLSLGDLHAIWENNNKTLIGFIAENNIPRFGFHGTCSRGVKGILHSRKSKGYQGGTIFVSGYKYSLDPITTLADIYTIRNNAWCYLNVLNHEHGGGTFVVNTSSAVLAKEGEITHHAIFVKPFAEDETFTVLSTDNPSSRSFLNLVERDGNVSAFGFNANGQIALKTEGIVNAAEYRMTFDPNNYNSRVKGVIFNEDSFYLPNELSRLHNDSYSASKGVMAERLKTQEIVIGAFEKLKIFKPFDTWKEYTNVGESLLKNFNNVTHISLEKVNQLNESSRNLNNINQEMVYHKRMKEPAWYTEMLHSELQNIHKPGLRLKEISPKKKFTHFDLDNGKGIESLNSYYLQNNNTILLEVKELKKHYRLNYQQLAKNVMRFAQSKGADRIILEVDLKEHLDLVLYFPNIENISNRAVVHGSSFDDMTTSYLNLLEISLK